MKKKMQKTLVYHNNQIIAYCLKQIDEKDIIEKDGELFFIYKIIRALDSCDIAYARKVDYDRKEKIDV